MADKYAIEYSVLANRDLMLAVTYITEKLHEKAAARRLLEAVRVEVLGLTERPERFPLVRDRYWADRGIRWFSVKNYRVFYNVDHDKRKVFIVRILYKRRNWQNIL